MIVAIISMIAIKVNIRIQPWYNLPDGRQVVTKLYLPVY
jgi:hypothetical protein